MTGGSRAGSWSDRDLPPGFSDLVPVGSGSAGQVFRARDDALSRTVALKLFTGSIEDDPAALAAFRLECATLGRLSAHPGVVSVHAAGLTPSGRPWLCMQFVERGSLARALRRDGPLPPAAALQTGVLLADTLAWAHALDPPVLHCDVKPGNILLADGGLPLLGDFGVSVWVAKGRSSVTVKGFTQAYAAPEVLFHGRFSPRSEVWSLAATLFEALTGAPPFAQLPGEGTGAFIERVGLGLPREAGTNLPEPLGSLLRRGLAVDRDDRWPSTAAFAAAIRETQASLGLLAAPTSGLDAGRVLASDDRADSGRGGPSPGRVRDDGHRAQVPVAARAGAQRTPAPDAPAPDASSAPQASPRTWVGNPLTARNTVDTAGIGYAGQAEYPGDGGDGNGGGGPRAGGDIGAGGRSEHPGPQPGAPDDSPDGNGPSTPDGAARPVGATARRTMPHWWIPAGLALVVVVALALALVPRSRESSTLSEPARPTVLGGSTLASASATAGPTASTGLSELPDTPPPSAQTAPQPSASGPQSTLAASATPPPMPPSASPQATVTRAALHAGQRMEQGQRLVSANGRYAATLRSDGNLVIYAQDSGPASPAWESGTDGTEASYLLMRSDGDLVLYGADGTTTYWSSGTHTSNSYLEVRDDGELVICLEDGTVLWSRTSGRG